MLEKKKSVGLSPIVKNKLFKQGREIFGVDSNDKLLQIAGAYYGQLDSQSFGSEKVAGKSQQKGSGLLTDTRNLVRKGFKKMYKIDNLRPLTDGEGPHVPYGNYAGPKTNLQEAAKYGVVKSGPMSVENSEGLSGDEISRQHDYMYLNAESIDDPKDKYDAIQYADKWFIEQVDKLPDSIKVTKKALYASIKAKYELEKKLGRLVYGGASKKASVLIMKPAVMPLEGGRKRKKKSVAKPVVTKKKVAIEPLLQDLNEMETIGKCGGTGYKPQSKKEHLKKRIEAEINDYVNPTEGKKAVELKTEFDSVESRIKKNLEKIKKQDDLEKAALVEDNKPLSTKDSVGRALTQYGFRKSTSFDEFENYEPYSNGETKQRWEYNIGFKTNSNISDSQRPRTGTYVWIDGIECPVSGNRYNYGLPVYLNNDGVYKIDNMDITISRYGDMFRSQSGGDLITALQKIKRGFYKFTANELLHLGEWDFILNKKLYYEPSTDFVTIERNTYQGSQTIDESRRIDLSSQLDQNREVSKLIDNFQPEEDKDDDKIIIQKEPDEEDKDEEEEENTTVFMSKESLEKSIAELKNKIELLKPNTDKSSRKKRRNYMNTLALNEKQLEKILDKEKKEAAAKEKLKEKRTKAIPAFIKSMNKWLKKDSPDTRKSIAYNIDKIEELFGNLDYSLILDKNRIKQRETIKKDWNDGDNSLIDLLNASI